MLSIWFPAYDLDKPYLDLDAYYLSDFSSFIQTNKEKSFIFILFLHKTANMFWNAAHKKFCNT